MGRSNAKAQPVYFSFGAKPANSKFATKTAKKKTVNIKKEKNFI